MTEKATKADTMAHADVITIDGSAGEGGGQILRTSLALSLVTGRPFQIEGIRAGRKKPGLLRQHLTAVNAATEIGQATSEGASLGSRELHFQPTTVVPGCYHFAVGTAGSATLVLQTVLPALLCAAEPSTLTLEGGTHNPFAPPFDFLEKAFVPQVNRMGPTVTATLDRAGFYPAGGGCFQVAVQPVERLQRLDLLERGEITERRAVARISGLSPNIGHRELKKVRELMGWGRETLELRDTDSVGPGNVLTLELTSDSVTEVFTGFGQRAVRAEDVARSAVDEARRYLASGAPVGQYLADQLLVPMALAGGGAFRTLPPSRHTLTNIEVLKTFLDIDVTVTRESRGSCVIELGAAGAATTEAETP